MSELPSGWSMLALGKISEIRLGKMLSAKAREAGLIERPYLRNENVRWGTVELTDLKVMGFKASELERYSVQTGDLVICEGGEAGRCAVYRAPKPVMYQKAIHRLRPLPGVALAEFVQAAFEYGIKAGCWFPRFSETTIQHLPLEKITAVEIPVPPLPEQQRIVAALDERLSELDASVAALERAERNLVRYRAAVLAAACSGKLVPIEADIVGKRTTYESADQLLARILTERRAANTKAKYEEPAKPDTSALPKLPEGWAWATFDQLSPRVTVGWVGPMKDEYVEQGVPFLRSQNVRPGRFEPVGLLFVSAQFHQRIAKSKLVPGDLVVVRSGSVGTTCVIPESLTEANCSDLVIIKKPIGLVPQYGAFYMNGIAKQRIRQGQVGMALTHFNTESVSKMPVPVPPLAEQHRIVAEVDRHLSRADALAASIAQAKRRAQRMRRAILAAAFEGRLVPQDPKDEPASVLLERLRAERIADEQDNKLRASGPRSQGRKAPVAVAAVATATLDAKTPKRRGRPPGAKNKAKA